jgi:glutamate-1-semialdehyde 2,1-aminomutase
LHELLNEAIAPSGVPYTINRYGSMLSIHFSEKPVQNFNDAAAANNALFNRLFHYLLDNGVYLPPSAYESWFISQALTNDDIKYTADVVSMFFKEQV